MEPCRSGERDVRLGLWGHLGRSRESMLIPQMRKCSDRVALLLAFVPMVACSTHDAPSPAAAPSYTCTHELRHRSEITQETLYATPTLYEIELTVGKEKIPVVADTGSSNLVVPGNPSTCQGCSGTPYVPTEQSTKVADSFVVAYGSGAGEVQEYVDQVGFLCGETLPYHFGLLVKSIRLGGGILGLAYEPIAQPAPQPIKPFFDQLVANHGANDIFTMVLCGTRSGSQVTLGDTDARATGVSVYTPIVEKSYYVVPAKGLQIAGGVSLGLGSFSQAGARTRTILDSGSTLLQLPPSVVASVLALMTQTVAQHQIVGIPADFWSTKTSGDSFVASISASDIAKFPTLELVLTGEDGKDFGLRIEPERYFKAIDVGAPERRIFGIRDGASDFIILGQVLFEGYVVTFDRANSRVGFASSATICR